MGCSESFVKYSLFIVNLLFTLAGLALLGLGITLYLKAKIFNLPTEQEEWLRWASIFLMVLGSFVFVVSFFGCCGAVSENHCMLVTFAVFMLILTIIKLAFAILVFVKLDKFVALVKTDGEKFITSNPVYLFPFEHILKCCGMYGSDYHLSHTPFQLPSTCCAGSKLEQVTYGTCYTRDAYQLGCITKVGDFISMFGKGSAIAAIMVATVELVGVVFGLCLANHVSYKDKGTHY